MNELGPPNIVDFLVVVGNPSDMCLTAAQMQEKGIRNRVHVVAGSQAAIDFLRRHAPYEHAVCPDVIVLHADLPASMGSQVLLEVNTNAALKHIPVLILNASDHQPDILDILALPLQKTLAREVSWAPQQRSRRDRWQEDRPFPE
jgi:CheY-like chemotaxis protein